MKSILSTLLRCTVAFTGALGLVACELQDSASSDSVSGGTLLAPRWSASAALPVVDSITCSLLVGGRAPLVKTLSFARGMKLSMGTVPNGTSYRLVLLGFDSSGSQRIARFWAGVDGIAGSTAVDTVELSPVVGPDLPSGKIDTLPVGARVTLDSDAAYSTDGRDPRVWGKRDTNVVGIHMATTLRSALRIPANSSTGQPQLWSRVVEWKFTAPVTIDTGSFRDDRDGQWYRTVTIGGQTWMAQNLNFKPSGADSGRCYLDQESYCDTYGRLYTWDASTRTPVGKPATPGVVAGICPSGWHVPSDSEWTVLGNHVAKHSGPDSVAAALRATAGSGTKDYFFRPLHGGAVHGDLFEYNGVNGYWWTSNEVNVAASRSRLVFSDKPNLMSAPYDKVLGLSLRCVKD